MTPSDPVIETARVRFVGLFRDVAVGGLAGVVSGFIIAGVGGRVAMRLTSLVAPAEAIGRRSEGGFIVGTVTFDGSLNVLFFVGSIFGLLGGLLLVILWPWVSSWGRWRSVAVGAFVLAVGSTEAVNPDNIDFAILGNQLFTVLLFWSLFFAWGFAAVWLRGLLDRRLPGRSRRATIVYGAIAALGLPLVLALPSFFFDGEFSGPILVAVSLMVLAFATFSLWALRVWATDGPMARAVRILGYTALTLTLVLGLAKAVSDAVAIIT